MFHVLNHATFKASLFMTAGIIDHETGTRDMRKLAGLWRFMPWTATLAMVAAAAMAGVPLANGFLSKEMFFDEALQAAGGAWGWIVPLVATVFGICSVAYSLRFIHDVFFNGEPQGPAEAAPARAAAVHEAAGGGAGGRVRGGGRAAGRDLRPAGRASPPPRC